MKADQFTDDELTSLTELAHRDWLARFDGALLPGRIQAMRMAGDMRKLSKMAAEVLQHDRGALTYAVKRMRESPENAKREATIIEALDAGLEYHEGQAALFREARERMRCADARLKLTELEE